MPSDEGNLGNTTTHIDRCAFLCVCVFACACVQAHACVNACMFSELLTFMNAHVAIISELGPS